MTWTWSDTDLSTDLAKVRVRIGDTNTSDRLLSDEIIDYYLDLHGDVLPAAVACLRAIIAKWMRDVDRSNLGMSATRSQKIQHARDLLKQLEAEMGTLATPIVGGISIADKATQAGDTDRVQPYFRAGQFDHNG